MKKHTTLMLLIACLVLSACAEEQVAQKASVDLKPAADSHTANVKGAVAGQKPAAPKPSTAAKEPAAPAKAAAKAPAAPAAFRCARADGNAGARARRPLPADEVRHRP